MNQSVPRLLSLLIPLAIALQPVALPAQSPGVRQPAPWEMSQSGGFVSGPSSFDDDVSGLGTLGYAPAGQRPTSRRTSPEWQPGRDWQQQQQFGANAAVHVGHQNASAPTMSMPQAWPRPMLPPNGSGVTPPLPGEYHPTNNFGGAAPLVPQATGIPFPASTYPPGPLSSATGMPPLPTPDGRILPLPLPGETASGPILFDGNIETLDIHDPRFPIPHTDPSLPNAGNGDGQLDWIDLIDEYAGRATRSDIPAEPHNTPMEDRSWLRIEHWNLEGFYIHGSGDQLQLLGTQAGVTLGIPKWSGITVTPSFGYYLPGTPSRTDVPDALYDTRAELAWMHRYSNHWRMRVAATAGLYSDSTIGSVRNSGRLSGQTLFLYEWNPDVQVVLGAAYVNLENRSLLPTVGVIWHPADDIIVELVYPEGRTAFKYQEKSEYERWAYIAHSFFGRTWNVERSTGGRDDLTYSDWRVALGLETRHISGIRLFGEAGMAWQRELDYASGIGNYNPDNMFLFSAGLRY